MYVLLLFFELALSDLTFAVVRTGDGKGNEEVGGSSAADELRLAFFVDRLRLSASPKAVILAYVISLVTSFSVAILFASE